MAEHRTSAATLIRTTFGFDSTAAEVVEGTDLAGKQAIVTGGASGIGVETARALAGAGGSVTLTARNIGDGEKVAAEIRSSTDNHRVTVAAVELTNYASIAAFDPGAGPDRSRPRDAVRDQPSRPLRARARPA